MTPSPAASGALAISITLFSVRCIAQQPTTGPGNAAELYRRAAGAIVADSPAMSDLEYPNYPPFLADWDRIARESFERNGAARELARQARKFDRAQWPQDAEFRYFGGLRSLNMNLADAALYLHLQNDDAAAIEVIRDLMHLSRMIRAHAGPDDLVSPVISGSFDSRAMDAMMIIASAVTLTADPQKARDLQVSEAKKLIRELLDIPEPEAALRAILGANYERVKADPQVRLDSTHDVLNRCYAERIYAAMSLACQLFRFEKGRWPLNLDELTPGFLPGLVPDPWGDGMQTFGYVLIKGGLPDGGDRPLVYSRYESKDGLLYRADEPQYCFYQLDGTDRPPIVRTKGGQFRDVTRWVPVGPKPHPPMRPIP